MQGTVIETTVTVTDRRETKEARQAMRKESTVGLTEPEARPVVKEQQTGEAKNERVVTEAV